MSHSSQKKTDLREQNSSFDGGKEALFLNMVESYQDAIFRFLYFRVSNRAVALDITQDTFTKTWVYLAGRKTIDYPEAFLYKTAKNALIDYYKKQKAYSLDTMIESGFDPESNKDVEEIDRADEIQEIRELLETLDEEDRHIIFLRFTEEKPIEEIAILYDKSANAMTVQIHRIIKKLKEKI